MQRSLRDRLREVADRRVAQPSEGERGARDDALRRVGELRGEAAEAERQRASVALQRGGEISCELPDRVRRRVAHRGGGVGAKARDERGELARLRAELVGAALAEQGDRDERRPARPPARGRRAARCAEARLYVRPRHGERAAAHRAALGVKDVRGSESNCQHDSRTSNGT